MGLGLVVALAVPACGGDDGGGDDGGGDASRFCERLDRLTRNDPFQAFGETASEADVQVAFEALRARAEELADVAPPAARALADDYRDAVDALDDLLADAGYGTDVDVRAYREQQLAYVHASELLLRYLDAEC